MSAELWDCPKVSQFSTIKRIDSRTEGAFVYDVELASSKGHISAMFDAILTRAKMVEGA